MRNKLSRLLIAALVIGILPVGQTPASKAASTSAMMKDGKKMYGAWSKAVKKKVK